MNTFFQGMKLVNYLTALRGRNCGLICTSTNVNRMFYNDGKVKPSLKIFLSDLTRSFTIYNSLLIKKEDNFDKIQGNKVRSRNGLAQKDEKVSVIDENDVEKVMFLSDAEKLAKRKKLKLIKLESSRADKIKYRLQRMPELLETSDAKKGKQKDKKRVMLREETQPHDVEIKINRMLKLIDKGLHVFCVIEGSGNSEKMAEVIDALERSKLKEYLSTKSETKRNVHLFFSPKSTENDNSKEENSENVQTLK